MAEDKKTTKKETKGKYIQAIGRRKTSVAQVRLYKGGKGEITVNDKKLNEFFTAEQIAFLLQPLKLTNLQKDLDFSIIVRGGGKSGQAESCRHGISRSLVEMDEKLRDTLKVKGYMTRDPRKKERKKPGLKKARKAPQWSKR